MSAWRQRWQQAYRERRALDEHWGRERLRLHYHESGHATAILFGSDSVADVAFLHVAEAVAPSLGVELTAVDLRQGVEIGVNSEPCHQALRHSTPLVQQPQLLDLPLVASEDHELARPDLAPEFTAFAGSFVPGRCWYYMGIGP